MSQKPRRRSQPKASENEAALETQEPWSVTNYFQNSYVVSRFWAWFSRVELSPKVRIPVPRFLTHRDP